MEMLVALFGEYNVKI